MLPLLYFTGIESTKNFNVNTLLRIKIVDNLSDIVTNYHHSSKGGEK